MELELGLGLALSPSNPIKGFGFDLNCNGFDPDEMEIKCHTRKKRCFGEAFEHGEVPTQTLPLVSWNDQPNEDEDQKGQNKRASNNNNMNDEQENYVVGWPPIKSWRRKLLHGHHGGRIVNNSRAERYGRTNSMYVKVNMEGVAIGRKINLRLFHGYQTLLNTLVTMFAKYQKIDKDGARFSILYKDKEGDWLLAGDVPWQTFTETAQRVEILRSAA